jgi:uncharacterized damage-inducible protein DinB
LYDYSSRVRARFAEKLAELPWQEVEKNREASFYSMKDIFIHMIDAEDRIVNWMIPGRIRQYTPMKFTEYTNMQMILDHLYAVEKMTRSYLDRISEADLQERVKWERPSGESYDLSIEECLLQSFTEQLYHIGELIALFWQENIEPPGMQWFLNNPRAQPK